MNSEFEKKLMRCPRLGHEITFSYCLEESVDLPCSRIVGCWSSFFDVEALLRNELPPDLWEKFVNSQPKDKVTSIIELIEKARVRR
jgi:hypothetical protein